MGKSELKICPDGSKQWFLNGKRHRKNGSAVIRSDGSKRWFLNGKCHREDGPAIIYPGGAKMWCLNGLLHREDGPAVIYPDGIKEWWVNSKELSFSDYKSWFLSKISNPSYELTDGDVEFIKECLEWINLS